MIALICPSNMLYMPYVRSYINILESQNLKYIIINWNRLDLVEEILGYTFKDKKRMHQRNYIDYIKYKNFIIDKLDKEEIDKVVVFTLQLGHILKKYLTEKLDGRYILDIRDYNRIFKFTNFRKLIESSCLCVISSPGYKEWLPESDKYVINHNTSVSSLDELISNNGVKTDADINIGTIGVLRHWKVNIDFVERLKNSSKYNLIFYGEGTINDRLKEYIDVKKLKNVKLYGRYKKEEEDNIYRSVDLINALFSRDNKNCKTLLANRLYNSVLHGKPMITLSGTYQAKIIKKYEIGLVLEDLDDLDKQIDEYLESFSCDRYNNGRVEFLKTVINENYYFNERVERFLLVDNADNINIF